MTTHELANILLQQEDVPVHFQYFDGGPDLYLDREVISVHEYKGTVYPKGLYCSLQMNAILNMKVNG